MQNQPPWHLGGSKNLIMDRFYTKIDDQNDNKKNDAVLNPHAPDLALPIGFMAHSRVSLKMKQGWDICAKTGNEKVLINYNYSF